jgi:lipid-binding SYLF domain-containing protein
VQQSFVVAVCLSTNAAQKLTESQMTLGGEARGTAGKDSAGTATSDDADRSVRVFFDRDGLYGGAALKGGAIAPDPKLNALYYERALSPREILFENKVKPSEAATELAGKIQAQTRRADKAQN